MFVEASYRIKNSVVRQLSDLIEENNWTRLFEAALKDVREYNIAELRDVSDLESYFEWLDSLLRWTPRETYVGDEIYKRVSEFYFILNQKSLKSLQNTILPQESSKNSTPLSAWMVAFAHEMGLYMDSEASVNEGSLESFLKSPKFKMNDYMPPPSGYKTFNQLFARHIKPGARPIDNLNDDSVIVSAADSTLVGVWDIDSNSTVHVKSLDWSIDELLKESPYRNRFSGGKFIHSFLNTYDYHRLHTPVSGVVLESRVILGRVYMDVVATPDEEGEASSHRIHRLHVQDGTGYQFAQARGLIVLDSPIGLVAVLPIGMAQVSSVVMTAEVGKTLHKGEEFSYFQFGGSDHIVLFEAACNINLTAQPNVHYNQGQAIGVAYPNS
ncbi:phosphatidylserine decarboxylase [Elstera litoralis]|uniref:Phosphatidylserine decarboxylase n=1 Tax=Elstera litoralis TaxID=552518 RepID=A0A0F3IIW6_9PROT|nr:phosphatidylserine decarboxylase [Elstera litoralis]KJV06705.1 phosphatidylserine decarboxylase [Elstera litoralis]